MARNPVIKKALEPYIRAHMLSPEPPPTGERGAAKWLRENLFSGPLNTILTLIGLIFVVWIVWSAFPWWWHSVWNASSLTECREIVAAAGGTDGACWAVIKARWHQYIYGFYPPELYWRPTVVFALMFVALAPILYWKDRKGAIMIAVTGVLVVLALWLLGAAAPAIWGTAIAMLGLFLLARLAPQHLLYVTLLFPFIGFFLLWGGSVWKPVATVLGFALMFFVFNLLKKRVGVVVSTGLGFVAAVIYWLVLQGYVSSALATEHLNWVYLLLAVGIYIAVTQISGTLIEDSLRRTLARVVFIFVWLALAMMNAPFFNSYLPLGTADQLSLRAINSDQFGGFLLAFVIGVTAIAASLPLGIMLALGRRSDMPLIKWLSVGFIEFIRGVPLITLLFTASLLLQYFLPPQTNFDLILRVIILASLFSSAYLAEVIRGGLAALPRGQYEAADALGLDYWQAQRLIVMPQALKISIPGIVSTFIGLFKDTTLVSFVGLLDPLRGVTMAVRADINWKGIYWEPYIFVGAIFFLICFGMSRYSMYLERKLKTDHR